MLHQVVFRNARTAERMRRMARQRGHVGGRKLWTEKEDGILRASYPDYKKAKQRLPQRTHYALKSRVRALSIQKRRHIWLGSEIARLRKLYTYASRDEIRSEFPFATWIQITAIATHYKIRRPRKRLCVTSFPIIDAIRDRCYQLGYSMGDLDAIARTGRYFQGAHWRNNVRFHGGHVCRAIEALGGTVSVLWED